MFWEILKASKGLPVTDQYAALWGQKIAGGWKVTEITGELPLIFLSDGSVLVDYRIYGTSEGAGVQTSGTEPAGYKIPLTVTSGEQSDTYPLYIGDAKLYEDEYVDYQEQKIYRTILLTTHDNKDFITSDNKRFCVRRSNNA